MKLNETRGDGPCVHQTWGSICNAFDEVSQGIVRVNFPTSAEVIVVKDLFTGTALRLSCEAGFDPREQRRCSKFKSREG